MQSVDKLSPGWYRYKPNLGGGKRVSGQIEREENLKRRLSERERRERSEKNPEGGTQHEKGEKLEDKYRVVKQEKEG